ncbi:MAG: hypothetical protein ACREIQ_06090, partial [Nitrospiria bacterium]
MIFLIIAAFFLPFLLIAGNAEAGPLSLSGGVDLNYGQTTLDTSTGHTTARNFLHHYSLGALGDLWDPRLGTYNAGISYQENIVKTNGVKNLDTDTLDYLLSISLLPRKTPLTLFAQRITRENDLPSSSSRNTLDTYSLTWDLPLRRIPALRFSLFQTDSKNTPSSTGTTRTRAASVDASQRFADTSIFARYQYSEQKSGISPTTTANNVNINGETRLS